MKKVILILSILIVTISSTYAQKVFSTKTGKISFYSNAPLEDIEAKTSEVESKLASSTGQVIFTLLIKGFQFPNQLMEDHFNENYLESSKFPKSDFKGYVTNIKDINFSKDGSYPAKVKGSLTIHGITRDIETNGTIEVKGAQAAARSKFNISLKDYGIGGALVGKKIADQIEVTIDCQYE